MTENEAIQFYLSISKDIQGYWITFGILAAILIGWFVSLKRPLILPQKLAVTIGHFIASGYIVSVLFNRYSIMNELIKDLERLSGSGNLSNLSNKIISLSSFYQHHEILIWTSYAFISIIFCYVIWSDIAIRNSLNER